MRSARAPFAFPQIASVSVVPGTTNAISKGMSITQSGASSQHSAQAKANRKETRTPAIVPMAVPMTISE